MFRSFFLVLAFASTAVRGQGWDDDDYYTLLGVTEEADESAIKKAYRRLSLKLHPDKPGGDAEKFAKISNAYEVLTDPNKRRLYDVGGEEALKEADQPEAHNPFGEIFGGFFGFGGGGKKKKPDLEIPLFVSLKDLYMGKDLEAVSIKQKVCRKCRATGAYSKNDIKQCDACQGKGSTTRLHQIAPGMYQQIQEQCKRCKGQGKIVKKKCQYCNGKKVAQGVVTHQVTVEKGMPDGQKIVFEHAGDESADLAPGSLVFIINTLPDSTFERDGHDLKSEVNLTLREALLGFEGSIPHLDLHDIPLSKSRPTQPGEVQRVKGEGMPHHDMPSDAGDLILTYNIEFPDRLSEEQRGMVRRMFPQ